MIRGYDLSQHQATTPNLANVAFVVLRATYGTTRDTRYDQHYAAARAAGVVTMAYAYGLPASRAPIADQAALFLEVAAAADFLWLDQEATGFDDAQAQTFIDAVRLKGRPCGLYHSASGFGGVNCDAKWVADWRDASEAAGYPRTGDGSKPFADWTIWQYDGGGADGLDNDYWNPERPIAGLLRKGYVPKGELDAAQEALAVQDDLVLSQQRANEELVAEIAALRADILTQANEITALGVALLEAQAQRDAAPAIERDRIAAAEAERIRAI